MKNIACAVLLCVVSVPLWAKSPASGSFTVEATVTGSCVILNSNNMPFGLYNPVTIEGSAEITAESNVSIRCTNGLTNVSVSLNEGENAPDESTCAQPQRHLISADNNTIKYQIYQDAERLIVWGCADNNAQVIPKFTSSIVPVQLNTYSRIPAGQNIAKGTYVDLVGVAVTF